MDERMDGSMNGRMAWSLDGWMDELSLKHKIQQLYNWLAWDITSLSRYIVYIAIALCRILVLEETSTMTRRAKDRSTHHGMNLKGCTPTNKLFKSLTTKVLLLTACYISHYRYKLKELKLRIQEPRFVSMKIILSQTNYHQSLRVLDALQCICNPNMQQNQSRTFLYWNICIFVIFFNFIQIPFNFPHSFLQSLYIHHIWLLRMLYSSESDR